LTPKLLGWITLLIVAAFGGGWLLGASGKATIAQERRVLEERADLSDAKAAVLDGRVSLYLVNFGNASRQFGQARTIVERVQVRLRESGQAERAGQLEIALAHLRDAERLSVALDQGAQDAAQAALEALQSPPSR
jgi:hypothetical protein